MWSQTIFILSKNTLFPAFGAFGLIKFEGIDINSFLQTAKVAPTMHIKAIPSPINPFSILNGVIKFGTLYNNPYVFQITAGNR